MKNTSIRRLVAGVVILVAITIGTFTYTFQKQRAADEEVPNLLSESDKLITELQAANDTFAGLSAELSAGLSSITNQLNRVSPQTR